ncbi:MAG: hypothetical protein ACE5PV_09725 [Candidatus Poribacteria bacterium]
MILHSPQDNAVVSLEFESVAIGVVTVFAVISLHQMHYLQMHYLTIRLNGNELTAEAKNLNGEVFDRFSIDKSSDGSREWKGLPPAPVFLVKSLASRFEIDFAGTIELFQAFPAFLKDFFRRHKGTLFIR